MRSHLDGDISSVNQKCLEAKVEENDYTVLTFDDLEYELELAEAGIRKKITFVENQVGRGCPFGSVLGIGVLGSGAGPLGGV